MRNKRIAPVFFFNLVNAIKQDIPKQTNSRKTQHFIRKFIEEIIFSYVTSIYYSFSQYNVRMLLHKIKHIEIL